MNTENEHSEQIPTYVGSNSAPSDLKMIGQLNGAGLSCLGHSADALIELNAGTYELYSQVKIASGMYDAMQLLKNIWMVRQGERQEPQVSDLLEYLGALRDGEEPENLLRAKQS